MSEEINRKISVILATDVVGYSKSMENYEAQTIRNLRACRELLDTLLQSYNGRVFNTAGDSILVEFYSAVSAVECAAAFQKQLQKRNKSLEIPHVMEFRIGINMGDVVIEGDNLYGDGVNIAARLEALAQPNGISISKSVYDLVNKKTSLEFNDQGIQEVKLNKFHVYDIILENTKKRELKNKNYKNIKNIKFYIATFCISLFFAGVVFLNFNQQEIIEPEELFLDSKAIKMMVGNFRYLSQEPETVNLAQGLTQAVRTKLSNYEEVTIPSDEIRNKLFKNGIIDETLSENLNIAYGVTGTVQKSGDSWRVTTELTDKISSKILWSKTADFYETDILKIQDEISDEVLASTMTKITMGEDAELDRILFVNSSDFLDFMNWRSNWLTRTPESLIKAEKLGDNLTKKLSSDNVYKYLIPGWNAFARLRRGLSENEATDKQIIYDSIEKSLLINPGYAHNLAGLTALNFEENCEKAGYHLEKFVEAGKNSNRYRQLGYVLITCNEPDKAIKHLNLALRLEPNAKNAEIKQMIIAAHMFKRNYEKALMVGEDFIEQGLKDKSTKNLVAFIYLLKGDFKNAKKYSSVLMETEQIHAEDVKKIANLCGYFCSTFYDNNNGIR